MNKERFYRFYGPPDSLSFFVIAKSREEAMEKVLLKIEDLKRFPNEMETLCIRFSEESLNKDRYKTEIEELWGVHTDYKDYL